MSGFRISRRRAGMAGLGLPAGLLAPAMARAGVPDTSRSPPQTYADTVSPGQVSAAIGQLGQLSGEMMRKSGVPGMAVAVVHQGRTVYLQGFGIRRVGGAEKVDADTVFQLASLSKPISATIVAHQVGQGGIAWNTPLVAHLPWFALEEPWVTRHVTVADMFCHRSGLPDHAGDDLEDLGYGREEILRRLRYLPLSPFRATYAYTNFGLTAAAQAVAQAAAMDWASLAENALYEKLGMRATSSRFADFMRRSNRAYPHVKVNGAFQSKYQRQPDAQSPAGGVSASARDLARWAALVLQGGTYEGKQIVATEALLPAVTAQMITGQTPDWRARPEHYGFGFNVGSQPTGRVTVSHSGAFAMGAGTNFVLLPSLDLGIIALTNAAPVGAAEALTASFVDLVQYGAVSRDWYGIYDGILEAMSAPVGALAGKAAPAAPRPPASLQAYVGSYRNDYYGPAEIALQDATLRLRLGPRGMEFPLRHWDGDIFVYTPAGENAPDGSRAAVHFTGNSFSIDFYAESGANQFVRT